MYISNWIPPGMDGDGRANLRDGNAGRPLIPLNPAALPPFMNAALSGTFGVAVRLRPWLDRAARLASMPQTHALDPHLAADVGLAAYTTTLAERRRAHFAWPPETAALLGSNM